MAGIMRVPRTRGALSGLLLILLGLWGGLLPFIGPYFGFGFAPDRTWVYTDERLVLTILPAAAVVLGGLMVLLSANRMLATIGGWLAALGGAWFIIGNTIAALWSPSGVGAPLGSSAGQRIAEQLAAFDGLGAAILLLSAFALGRFAVVGVREQRRRLDQRAGAGASAGTGAGATQPTARDRYTGQAPPRQRRPAEERHIAGERRRDR